MKKVNVLMSTYNGERYLKEQLDSILNQIGVEVDLLVRDDGSTDDTIKILEDYKKNNLLDWYSGSNLKPAKSFMDLLKNSKKSDYYAFADQDDYWEPIKLQNALKRLEKNTSNNVKLYMSVLNVVDENLKFLYKSKIPSKVTLKNEMIKNYATGCTMVFDNNMKEIINNINYDYIAMHDSLIFRIALLYNSYVYIDKSSYIKYRQHNNNVLGMKADFFSIWKNRWNHFSKSECIARKTANEFINNKDIKISKNDYNYLNLIANYKKNFKYKLKLLNMNIFGKEEKMVRILFKIKLIFNKI